MAREKSQGILHWGKFWRVVSIVLFCFNFFEREKETLTKSKCKGVWRGPIVMEYLWRTNSLQYIYSFKLIFFSHDGDYYSQILLQGKPK
jgi:hypothetical protein